MVATVDALLLLGWMTEKEATDFLRKECAEAPNEEEAHKIWRDYRDKVEALPERTAPSPQRHPLSRNEKELESRFLAFLYKMGIRDVREVIKIEFKRPHHTSTTCALR